MIWCHVNWLHNFNYMTELNYNTLLEQDKYEWQRTPDSLQRKLIFFLFINLIM
jgi:hypothetical protein